MSRPSERVVFGQDESLIRLKNAILDKDITIIGVYGVAGIGKTTLVQTLFTDKEITGEYEFVDWVRVGREGDIKKGFQSTIMTHLGLHYNESQENKSATIFRELQEKKFMIVFDDIWMDFDPNKIGVPTSLNARNNSKIIFITRSEDTAAKQAEFVIKVNPLSTEEAWAMFLSIVGDKQQILERDHRLRDLAVKVVQDCGGVPSAISVIGAAIRNSDATVAAMEQVLRSNFRGPN